jgi:hypothetical protein
MLRIDSYLPKNQILFNHFAKSLKKLFLDVITPFSELLIL